MTWILNLDATASSDAIVGSIRVAARGVHAVATPDPTDRAGVVVCSTPSPELHQILVRTKSADTHVIVVSAADDALEPWSLLAAGASDLVIWDGDPQPVRARLERLFEIERIIDSPQVSEMIVGRSPALLRAMRDLVTAAKFGNGPILILGESGTGKELAARLAHSVSGARSGAMVVVDCTTIVPTLAGSELFGHERGAFTGASTVRTGACAAADGGTLFLDEVGDLPLDLQPELLRVVQEGTYKRVGADTWLRSTFRLICATNRALEDEVVAGRFRADFYYRIVASTVMLPPLRERAGDLIPLFKAFFAQVRGRPGDVELTPAVEAALRERAYAGNLRDLRQLAHRVAARHVGPGPLTPGDLPPSDRPMPPDQPDPSGNGGVAARAIESGAPASVLDESVRAVLRQGMTLRTLREHVADVAVAAALEESGGNVRAAATRLGVTDRALHLRRAQRRA